MLNRKWQIVVPDNHPNPPEPHEIEVAEILARHYNCIVEFIIPTDDYKRKTPDIVMDGIIMEIKSPIGNSRRTTVRAQFDRATNQLVSNLVFDCQRTKLPDDFLQKEVLRELGLRRRIKRVIFITKSRKVLEFGK